MSNCSVCREELGLGERVVFNHRETFVFKPAEVPDVTITRKTAAGKEIQVPAAAVLSQQELLESRKEHTRTTVAITYAEFGREPIPEFAFGLRHAGCVQVTGSAPGLHGGNKHAIRYRGMKRGAH